MNASLHRSVNVMGGELLNCSSAPRTGFFRSGCCDTSDDDHGCHTVCSVMTDEFLAFSKQRGNDLSTPALQHGFPGLRAGDRWCLCAARWQEAFVAGFAPQVVLASTHERTLEHTTLDALMGHAIDLA
jgi:uncharacterized protein